MVEEWRPVAGWEGYYEISETGRCRSLDRTVTRITRGKPHSVRRKGRELSGNVYAPLGYRIYSLSRPGEHEFRYAHRLVCEAWHGPPPEKHDAAHGDGSRLNNDYRNLRWATRQENLREKAVHGTQPRGDDLWFTKISDSDCRAVYASNEASKDLALRYGVSESLIYRIRTKRLRQHALEAA